MSGINHSFTRALTTGRQLLKSHLVFDSDSECRARAETEMFILCEVCDAIGRRSARLRQERFDIFVGARDHVDGNDLADLTCCGRASISGSFDRANIASNHDGNQATADLLTANEPHVRRLDHRIGGFDCGHQAFGFNKA
jgi:hypothetical protein